MHNRMQQSLTGMPREARFMYDLEAPLSHLAACQRTSAINVIHGIIHAICRWSFGCLCGCLLIVNATFTLLSPIFPQVQNP